MGRLPSKSGGATHRRLHRRQQQITANIVINTVAPTIANEQYVQHHLFMSVSIVVVLCTLLLCMFCCSSSLLDHCMLVSILVMNYLLELIMNLSNFPTETILDPRKVPFF